MGERKGTGFWVFGFFFVRAWVDGRYRMGFGISVHTQKEVHPTGPIRTYGDWVRVKCHYRCDQTREEEEMSKNPKSRLGNWGVVWFSGGMHSSNNNLWVFSSLSSSSFSVRFLSVWLWRMMQLPPKKNKSRPIGHRFWVGRRGSGFSFRGMSPFIAGWEWVQQFDSPTNSQFPNSKRILCWRDMWETEGFWASIYNGNGHREREKLK